MKLFTLVTFELDDTEEASGDLAVEAVAVLTANVNQHDRPPTCPPYLCEQCGVESHIDLDEDSTFTTTLETLRADHYKWSPECEATEVRITDIDDRERYYYARFTN